MARRRHRADRVLDGLAEAVGPTPEQRARNVYAEVNPAEIDSAEQPIGRAWRNLTATPLDRYHRRGLIDDRRWQAGERLRADFHRAQLGARVTLSYAAPTGAGQDVGWQMPAGDRQAEARDRWRRALAALGPGLAALVAAAVCEEATAADLGARLGRSGRNAEVAGMTALAIGLDLLADHYRL